MRLLVPPLFLSVLLLGVSGPTVLRAQTVKPVKVATDTITFVTPLLIDENGEPMVGLTLINRNQKISKTTDANGSCSLAGAKNEVLEVRALGSLVNTYVLSDDRFPTITVSTKHPAVQRLKPVRLLNNTQMQSDLTAASTQTVYNNDLTKMPVASFLNALPGRFAGLGSIQGSGEPGSDGTALSLRNQGPLVVIDGIPRNITVFDLEEIESVTVLKDALATAMLGVRSSNGVLLVNTRKGFASRPRISFTAQTAVQQPLRQPKTLGSYDYARLYNEALTNDGLPEAYTQQDLEGYRSRSDPFRYPDVDWRKQVLKPSSRMDRYTFSASGGNSFSRYFVSLEHLNQTGLLRTSDINTYNTNNDFKVYTVRSNVDLNLNSKLSAGIHLFGRILNSNDAGYVIPNTNTTGTTSIFNALINTPNNAYPIYNPNGTYGGTTQFQNNIWAQAIGSGYRQNYQRDMLADFYLKRTLDEVTKGLWIRATGSYYATLSENIARNKTFAVFQQTAADVYQQFGVNGDQANSNGIDFQSRADYLELALGYDRAFGQHGIQAIVLGNRDNAVGGSDLPYTITGTSGRFSYNYSGKYIAEASFAVNGSNRYPEDGRTRVGFFPAFGLGWNLSKEEFMKSLTWLTHLKAFASVGKTGNDRPGYFRYIQTYFDSPSVFFGTGAGSNTAITEQPLANYNITWEKANKLNAGLQGGLWDNRLGFTLEYYQMNYYDLLMRRGRNSSILGNTFPEENIGRNRYRGWELQLNYQRTHKQLSYYVNAMVGVQYSKSVYSDEVFREYSWMQRTGQPVNQRFGYIAEGLFQSATEIQSAATIIGYTPQPGDIKYRDLNQDGIINQLDMAPIGRTKPQVPFGVGAGLTWKSFDLTLLLQGALNRDMYLSGNSEWAFQNNGFGPAFEPHLDRWTPGNPGASYPRLNVGSNVNNFETSSYWVRNGDYLRIKNLEIGYSLPTTLINRIRVKSLRVFASGTNLLTLNSMQRIDPEAYNGAYPLQRLFNLGINLKL